MVIIWQIGSVSIPNQIVLAPMAGVTDKAFRIIAKEYGCGLVYTEMISAKALTYRNIKTKALLDLEGEKQPVSVQLFGCEPEIMALAASVCVEQGAQIIDVNMGCPVPKVVKNQEGSALLEEPKLAGEIIKAIAKVVNVPVTAKIRTGFTKEKIVAVEFAKALEEAGAKAIAVHGRSRDQYYSGEADWGVIGRVKEALNIPVIANGDIWCPEDAEKMLAITGCDAVMIGRGALGNPWLILNTLKYLQGKTFNYPSTRDKILGAITHLDLMVKMKGEFAAIREMRKHIAWYVKGLPKTAALKNAVFKASAREQVIALLEGYLKEYGKTG